MQGTFDEGDSAPYVTGADLVLLQLFDKGYMTKQEMGDESYEDGNFENYQGSLAKGTKPVRNMVDRSVTLVKGNAVQEMNKGVFKRQSGEGDVEIEMKDKLDKIQGQEGGFDPITMLAVASAAIPIIDTVAGWVGSLFGKGVSVAGPGGMGVSHMVGGPGGCYHGKKRLIAMPGFAEFESPRHQEIDGPLMTQAGFGFFASLADKLAESAEDMIYGAPKDVMVAPTPHMYDQQGNYVPSRNGTITPGRIKKDSVLTEFDQFGNLVGTTPLETGKGVKGGLSSANKSLISRHVANIVSQFMPKSFQRLIAKKVSGEGDVPFTMPNLAAPIVEWAIRKTIDAPESEIKQMVENAKEAVQEKVNGEFAKHGEGIFKMRGTGLLDTIKHYANTGYQAATKFGHSMSNSAHKGFNKLGEFGHSISNSAHKGFNKLGEFGKKLISKFGVNKNPNVERINRTITSDPEMKIFNSSPESHEESTPKSTESTTTTTTDRSSGGDLLNTISNVAEASNSLFKLLTPAEKEQEQEGKEKLAELRIIEDKMAQRGIEPIYTKPQLQILDMNPTDAQRAKLLEQALRRGQREYIKIMGEEEEEKPKHKTTKKKPRKYNFYYSDDEEEEGTGSKPAKRKPGRPKGSGKLKVKLESSSDEEEPIKLMRGLKLVETGTGRSKGGAHKKK